MAAPDVPIDLTLRLDHATQVLQLIDQNDAVVASKPLADTSSVEVTGSNEDDRLTVDYRIPFSLPVAFAGAGQSGTGADALRIIGDGTLAASYLPDGTTSGSGTIVVGGSPVSFTGPEPVTISDMGSLTFITPNSADALTVDSPAPGQSRLLGSSDAVEFAAVTFFDISSVTVDTGTNDGAAADDAITIASELLASGLETFAITSGAGSDTLTLNGTDLSLPVPGGVFTFDAGGGADTLVGPDAANTWDITGPDTGNLGGADDLQFSGVENLTGGAGDDAFVFVVGGRLSGVIAGGPGDDTLVGADTDNTWVITGTDAGTLNGQTFVGIENLIGGAEADRFVFAGGRVSGTIDGRGGANIFDYSASAVDITVDLGAGTATGAGRIASFTRLVGGAGSDTLIGPEMDNAWEITGADTGRVGAVAFTGIENLIGGSEADAFILGEFGSLSGLLTGGLGNGTLVGADTANTWEITAADGGTLNGLAFFGMGNLFGGALDDLFVFALAGSLSGAIAGGLGADRVRGADKRNRWTLTGPGTATVDAVSLSGVEHLDGGSEEDEFVFADGAAFGGNLGGGGGRNTLDYSAYTTAVTVNLATGAASATGTGGVTGIVEVIGSRAGDTLVGPEADAAWTLTAANTGTVGTVAFRGIENLRGAADNRDTFVIASDGSVSGLVDGGAGGFDTITINAGPYSRIVLEATGPGSGSISLDGIVIAYAGLEPVLVDTTGSTAADLVLKLPDTPDNAEIIHRGGNDFTVRSTDSSPTFEQHDFIVNGSVNSVTINLGGGSDTITLRDLAGTALDGRLTVSGGIGDDVISIQEMNGVAAYTIDGQDGEDRLVIAAGTFDTITYNVGGSESGTIDFDDGLSTRGITYSGIRSISDSSSASTRVFNATDSAETIRLIDDSGGVVEDSTIDSDGTGAFAPVTFANPTAALQIDAKGGSDTMTIHSLDPAFTGELILIGGSGDDTLNGIATYDETYKFGDDWGNDQINDAGGTELLDFSAFTGTLKLRAPSTLTNEVEGIVGNAVVNTLNHTVGGAATFTTDIDILGTQDQRDALTDGLTALTDLGDALDAFDRLAEPLFLLDGRSIGELLDIGAILDSRIAQTVTDFLASDSDPTLDELVAVLDQPGGTFGDLQFDIEAVGTLAGTVLTIDLVLHAQRSRVGEQLSLGDDIGELLIADGLTGDVTAGFDWSFSIGVDFTGLAAFFADFPSDMAVTADVNLPDAMFAARAGFLGLDIGTVSGNTSSISLNADVTVDTSTLGMVTLGTLQNPVLDTFVSHPGDAALVDIDLFGLAPDVTGVADDPLDPARITFSDDLFTTADPVLTDNFATLGISDFFKASGDTVRSQLQQFRDFLGIFDTKGLNLGVPLTRGQSVGDLFDLAGLFQREVLARLELPPNTASTLVQDLNDGDGVETVAGNDIKITLRDGTSFEVDLDHDPATATLGDLAARIASAASGAGVTANRFEVRTDPDNGALSLVDFTDGTDTFKVEGVNGSSAASGLGLDLPSVEREVDGAPAFVIDLAPNPGPNFSTVQQMAANANLGPNATIGNIAYLAASHTLSFDLSVTLVGDTVTDTLALFDMEPLTDLVTNSPATLTPTGLLNLPLEILLTDVGFQVTESIFVSELNRGRGVKTLLGQHDIRVQLLDGTSFAVNLDHDMASIAAADLNGGLGVRTVAGADIEVRLRRDNTSFQVDLDHGATASVEDLLNLIRNAVPAALASGDFEAVSDADRGTFTLIDRTTGPNAFEVVALNGSHAGSDLSLVGTTSVLQDVDGSPAFAIEVSIVTLGDLMGRIRAAATAASLTSTDFDVDISVDGTTLVLVDRTMAAASIIGTVTTATTGSDLQDTNANFGPHGSLIGRIVTITSGSGVDQSRKIVGNTQTTLTLEEPWSPGLGVGDGYEIPTTFDVAALNGSPAQFGLGLFGPGTAQVLEADTLASDANGGLGVQTVAGADIEVRLRDGTRFQVDLNSDPTSTALPPTETLGDLMGRIRGAAASAGVTAERFEARIDPNTGELSLVDRTTGANAFEVVALNGSSAGADLSLVGTASVEDDVDLDGVAEFVIALSGPALVIDGNVLHGDTPSAHIGLRQGSLATSVGVHAPSVDATGRWGPLAVTVAGGSAAGTVAVTVNFADPGTDGADGLATFRELNEGLGNTAALIASQTVSGSLTVDLPLDPAFPGVTGPDPVVHALVSDITDPDSIQLSFQPDDPTNPVQALLEAVAELTVDDVIAALDDSAGYLIQLEQQPLLGGQGNLFAFLVPGLNRSLGQLVSFGTTFSDRVATLADDPPGTLQEVVTALNGLPGISGAALAFDATTTALEVDLDFTSPETTTPLPLMLNLTALGVDLGLLGLDVVGVILDLMNASPLDVLTAGTVNLDLGIDLMVPSNPTSFLFDTTSASFDLKVAGQDLNFETLLGMLSVHVVGGSFTLDQDGAGPGSGPALYRADLPSGHHALGAAAAATTVTLSGALDVTLPFDFPDQIPDTQAPLALQITDLGDAAGTTTLSGPDVAALQGDFSLLNNLDSFRLGFDRLFAELDAAFDQAVFGHALPLIGSGLTFAADFIEQVRAKVSDNLQLITGILTPTNVQQALFDALGPGGMGWLVDSSGDGSLNTLDDVGLTASASEVIFEVDLEIPQQLLSLPVPLDLTLPGLGLTIDALVQVEFGFRDPLTLRFGVDAFGAFIDVSALTGLTLDLDVTLPALQPLTAATPVREANHGRGVRTATGNDIEVRLSDGTTFRVDLDYALATSTVGDLMNAIQAAAASAGVPAANFEIRVDPVTGEPSLVDRTKLFAGTATPDSGQTLAEGLADDTANFPTNQDEVIFGPGGTVIFTGFFFDLTGRKVTIIDGTGAGQARTIVKNTQTTLVLDEPWGTPLDATSGYVITEQPFTIVALNGSPAAFDLGLRDFGVLQDVDGSPGSVIGLDVKGFEAQLGFLPYRVFDLLDKDATADPTALSGTYTLDVREPAGNGRLSSIELMTNPADSLVDGSFAGDAEVHLRLETDLPPGAAFPPYRMDLNIPDWVFTAGDPVIGESSTALSINFDNVQFELVGFMKDFVGSAVTRLRTAFQPLDGLVNFLNSEAFPIISLLFGRAPYVSANSFGGSVEIGNFAGASLMIRNLVQGGDIFDQGSITEFLEDIGILRPEFDDVDVVPIAELTGEAWIDLGAFTVDETVARGPSAGAPTPTPKEKREFGEIDDGPDSGTILGQVRAIAADLNHEARDAALGFLATQLLPGRQGVAGVFGAAVSSLFAPPGIDPIALPILTDAVNSFELLLGETAINTLGDTAASIPTPEASRLLSYGTPELFVLLYQDIPLTLLGLAKKTLSEGVAKFIGKFDFGPQPYLVVAFEARADFQMEFDTTGLATFAISRNPDDIVNGLFFDDSEGVEENPGFVIGSDPDEDQAVILGGIGLGYQFVFDAIVVQFKIGIEGIVFFGSSWNFHDPNGDGLIRADEFDRHLLVSTDNVFDQSFVIEFRLDVFAKLKLGVSIFKVTIFDIRVNILTATLEIPFSQTPVSPPLLATLEGSTGTLNLNIGDRAPIRGFAETEVDEVIYIGADPATDRLIVSGFGHGQTFTLSDVDRIVGFAGSGKDRIIISDTVMIPVEVHGGGGDDYLVAGGGGVMFFGDADEDILLGSRLGDVLEGGAGADLVHGRGGSDTIHGGPGPDHLFGWRDSENIFGDEGDDTIVSGAGDDSVSGGPDDDEIDGGDGADVIDGGAGKDVIRGGLGNDTILGGPDADDIEGGQHNDLILGGDGNDFIDGGGATDVVFGDNGSLDFLGAGLTAALTTALPTSGSGGDDTIVSNDGNDVLDGQGGSDTYILTYKGPLHTSRVSVFDSGLNSGVSAIGTDLMDVTGTAFDDNFLLRAATASDGLAFVALINDQDHVERIDYLSLERLVVNGLFGDDVFTSDDTRAIATLNGGEGADRFQIAQMFRSPRISSALTGIAMDDAFATIETTRGFLSNGITLPMTINGGGGNDEFVVFHNLAVLTLNGDEGDDSFTVRAFALVGSQEPQQARTDLSGGAGADLIEYAVNAPVNIDGGDGFDTVIVIGTEFGDDFVVTEDGIFGAGLSVSFVGVESVKADGAEGDDRFFVQSTKETTVTVITGGLGSDTFSIAGDTPPVVSNDLLGHSGIITHSVVSTTDQDYDGLTVEGISAHVADNEEPGVVITQSGGSTVVTEGGAFDTYTVVLTRRPTAPVTVTVEPPTATPEERARGAQKVNFATLFGVTPATITESEANGTIATADAIARASFGVAPNANVGDDSLPWVAIDGFIGPSLNDVDFYRFDMRGGERLILDIDFGHRQGDSVDTQLHVFDSAGTRLAANDDASTSVGGGGSVGFRSGRSTTYDSYLEFLIPADGFYFVAVTSYNNDGSTGGVFNNNGRETGDYILHASIDRAQTASSVLTFTADNWFIPQTVRVEAVDDGAIEGLAFGAMNHSVASADTITGTTTLTATATLTASGFPTEDQGLTGARVSIIGGPGEGQSRLILSNTATELTLSAPWTTDASASGTSIFEIKGYDDLAVPSVTVEINDNDAAGVLITETDGSTDLAETGATDQYTVVLLRQPMADVVITLNVDDQLQVSTPTLTFTPSTWNVPQPVTVTAVDDTDREGPHHGFITHSVVSADQDRIQTAHDVFNLSGNGNSFVLLSNKALAGQPVTVTVNGVGRPANRFIVASNTLTFTNATGTPELVAGNVMVDYSFLIPGYAGLSVTRVSAEIADNDVAGVLITQTSGSTNVIEVRDDIPSSFPTDSAPWVDSYQVMLTRAPVGEVMVTVTPEVTKTTRTGGIRHDLVQVAVSSSAPDAFNNLDGTVTLTFDASNWNIPQIVNVEAINDDVVDGGDTKVFAPMPHTLGGIQGPLFIDGAAGAGSLGIGEAVLLPGETNVKESTGDVGSAALDSLTVLTDDLLGLPDVLTVADVVGKTVEITVGPIVDQFRLITGTENAGTDVLGRSLTRLLLNEDWDFGENLTPEEQDALLAQFTEYAITNESLNFFVNEAEQVDFIFVFHEDSVADLSGSLTNRRLTGLGMGPDVEIGGVLQPGGIIYGGLEVVEVNLGLGNETLDVTGTHTRRDNFNDGFQTWTMVNTGGGNDVVTVLLNEADEIPAAGTADAGGTRTTLRDADGGFGPNDSLKGHIVRITAGTGIDQARRILSNTASELTVDRPWGETEIPDHTSVYEVINEADGALALNTQGGNDIVDASASTLPLIIFGGLGDDDITAGSADDLIFGDRGRVDYFDETGMIVTRLGVAPKPITGSVTPPGGTSLTEGLVDNAADFPVQDNGLAGLIVTINNGTGFGQSRLIAGNTENELTLDAAWDIPLDETSEYRISTVPEDQTDGVARPARFMVSIDPELGGDDTLRGGADQDVIIGGAAADRIDGNEDDDLIFGDNVELDRRADTLFNNFTNPRFRTLSGPTIYDGNGAPLIDDTHRLDPTWPLDADGNAVPPVWGNWEIKLRDEIQHLANFGGDYIAGGAGNDMIFGQLGDDTIQGDGSITTGAMAARTAGGLTVAASTALVSDGDDYIEGNGGSDVIFGNLGQDDIIGGSSNLFSLTTPNRRSDGSDLIFGGGGGADILRNDLGQMSPENHARDADMILGDNGNIYRLVGSSGQFLVFEYDKTSPHEARGSLRIIPRAAHLLDYTPGGPDFAGTVELGPVVPGDIGTGDEIHGGWGDDFIYGMVGNDQLFGDGQDDDLVGGYGHDWVSGGTGQDGVLGDDGRIFTSRNGTAEPLYGILATTQGFIDTPGGVQQADINVTGHLKKAVDLTPFNPVQGGHELSDPRYADDIIYGGLGSDFLHGGAGDDAISGAEVLPQYFDLPFNPGNVLRYSDVTGEFAEYDEFEPRLEIFYGAQDGQDVVFNLPGGGQYVLTAGSPFILNFEHTEGPVVSSATWGDVHTDGDDKIFGDLGNDWLMGGTGRDNLYGGWGDDLLNADDDHQGPDGDGLNDVPDTHPSYEDRAYGGAGRDRLIANTGGDRLIDWAGEFNSYIVPFAPFGLATVSRMLAPSLAEFLYALSASDGADPTRGGDPARNGEPDGELGLVRQQDFAWHDQTGAPDDPQPGNIPGGKRDVLRSASFDDPAVTGFFADSGVWQVSNGALQVSAASLGGDAVSVYHVGDALPAYFELQASVKIEKPTGGWKGNAYVIFDYQDERDFKFVGIDESINKLVMGHRDAIGWHVDEQAPVKGGVKSGQYYNMLVAINGVTVTLVVDNERVFTHTYQPRVLDGYAYGLNWGLVGVGSDNSRGTYDNIRVQILPPQLTFDETEDFTDGVADRFTGGTSGVWSVERGRYSADPGGTMGTSLLDLGPDHLNFNSFLEFSARVNTQDRAGFIFDRYGEDSFKFVVIEADDGDPDNQGRLIIGHYTKKGGWADDAFVSTPIAAGADYTLTLTLKGSTVSATLNPAGNGGYQAIVGHAFNAATVDGGFGLLSRNGTVSFDDVRVRTNDPAFRAEGPAQNLMAAAAARTEAGTTLTLAELTAVAEAALARWAASPFVVETLGSLADVRFRVTDLPDGILGQAFGRTVLIDVNGAGHGWFIDPTALGDVEFPLGPTGGLVATPWSGAAGRMDLLTTVLHEVGHVLGLSDVTSDGYGADLMGGLLATGVRRLTPGANGLPESPLERAPAVRTGKSLLVFGLDGEFTLVEGERPRATTRGRLLDVGLLRDTPLNDHDDLRTDGGGIDGIPGVVSAGGPGKVKAGSDVLIDWEGGLHPDLLPVGSASADPQLLPQFPEFVYALAKRNA